MNNTPANIPNDDLNPYEILNVNFDTNAFGVMALDISTSAQNKPATLYLSAFRDPFNEMVLWLEQIADNRLPAAWVIQSEVSDKSQDVLWAGPLSNNRLDFRITTSADLNDNAPSKLRVIVRRKQLVRQFVKAFKTFVRETYQPAHWVNDLREVDLSRVVPKLDKKKV